MTSDKLSVIKRVQLYFSLIKFFKTVERLWGVQFRQNPVAILEKEQRYETLKLCRSLLVIQHKRLPVEETVLECLELFCETPSADVNEIQMILMSHFIVLRDNYYGSR